MRRATPWLCGILLVLVPVVPARGWGRLPVDHVDRDDGLASDVVVRIVPDSAGFLWFAAEGGVSRYDGARFVTYGRADGLRGTEVEDVAETRDGLLWFATDAGLFRLDPRAPRRTGEAPFREFELPDAAGVRRLHVDAEGTLWAAAGPRVFRIRPGTRDWTAAPVPLEPRPRGRVTAFGAGAGGALWIGTHYDGLYQLRPGGGVRHWPVRMRGAFFARDFAVDADGRTWTTFLGGVARLRAAATAGGRAEAADPADLVLTARDGLPSEDTTFLAAQPDGTLLVGTTGGVAVLARDGAELPCPGAPPASAPRASARWRVAVTWTHEQGLPTDNVAAFARDPAGDLWLGSPTRGAMRIVRNGITRVPEIEHRSSIPFTLLAEEEGAGPGRGGGILALATVGQRRYRVHRVGPAHIGSFDVRLPEGVTYLGWWPGARLLRDRTGSFWLTTGEGLLLYRDPGRRGVRRLAASPDARFDERDGLPGPDVAWVFEDRRGRLFVGAGAAREDRAPLAWRAPGARGFTRCPPPAGIAPRDLCTAIAEDAQGTIWIGFLSGALARFDEGRLVRVATEPALPASSVMALVPEPDGRLLVLGDGARVLDEPRAAVPRASSLHPSLDDLSIRCAVRDGRGRLFLGTGRGVVELGPGDGAAPRVYTRSDGLPGNSIALCLRDAAGNLWFSDLAGLARLVPGADRPPPGPRTRIAAARVDGTALPLPPLGTTAAGPFTLPRGAHNLAVELLAVRHGGGDPPRFEHRFDGPDPAWSAPSAATVLEFPNLAPGRYRLQVRAVAASGGEPGEPASLAFSAAAPVWRSSWFVAGAAALLAGAVAGGYRLRVRRLLAIERMRTRIASDLHDDVGADLSRLALLAEVAAGDIAAQPERARALMGEAARTAREAVDGMADIVWALKPGRGDLAQLFTRLRDAALEAASAGGPAVVAVASPGLEDIRLAPEPRRDLYLILKEAVANAVRHAAAARVEISLRAGGEEIAAEVRDDGRGFDPASRVRSRGGQGLANMRARAARIGARLDVWSVPGQGTTVRVALRRE